MTRERRRRAPTFGLDGGGRLVREFGGATATITVIPPGGVVLRFSAGGAERVPPDAAADLRYLVRHLEEALAGERARFEDLLSCDLSWPAAQWRAEVLGHPLASTVAAGLVWEVETGEGAVTGMPAREDGDWVLIAADGAVLPRPAARDGASVRLWHPVGARLDDVRAWRKALAADPARQPFEQVFRPVHLLAPAERETRSYSNRFAAHLLHRPLLEPLIRRGRWEWTEDGRAQSYIDRDELTGTFAEGGWQARFYVDEADGTDALYATDQVRFYRHETGGWLQADLEAVPRRVFSDAMRDVEAWITAASVAADPGWSDAGGARSRPAGAEETAAWHERSFGDLSEAAERRRATLARLLPGLAAADRLELTDRFLKVRGTLRTYKIHLGSASIQMEPDDSYLCVVASRRRDDPAFLPVEGDQRLALILSKALLLADDAAITDPTIRGQLRGRG